MPKVLATGFMVGLFEFACVKAINPHIDWPNEQTVGTRIDVSHIAATPPGMTVTVKGKLEEVEGRKLRFSVAGYDEIDKISEGIHERFIIDADPFKIESLWRNIYASGYDQHPDLTKMGIISGFEIACWDIIGKALDQPIYNLLGGQYHEKLRSYTYINPAPNAPPEKRNAQANPIVAGERAAEYVKMGFTALKFDPVAPPTVHDGARSHSQDGVRCHPIPHDQR